MSQGRPPISTTTRLYGHFAYQIDHRPQPVANLVNTLLDQRGVDALWMPLQLNIDLNSLVACHICKGQIALWVAASKDYP